MRSCLVSQDTSLPHSCALLSHSFMLARPSPVSPSASCCRNLFLICLGFFTIFASIFICCQLLIAVCSVRNEDDRLEEEEENKREVEITREIVDRKIFGYKHSVECTCMYMQYMQKVHSPALESMMREAISWNERKRIK